MMLVQLEMHLFFIVIGHRFYVFTIIEADFAFFFFSELRSIQCNISVTAEVIILCCHVVNVANFALSFCIQLPSHTLL